MAGESGGEYRCELIGGLGESMTSWSRYKHDQFLVALGAGGGDGMWLESGGVA